MTTTVLPARAKLNGFVPMASGVLRLLCSMDVDLFLWNEKTGRPVLFRDAETPLDRSRIGELVEKCGEYLYVRSSDFNDVCSWILNSLEDVTDDESLTAIDRFHVMQLAVSFEVEKTLKATDAENYVSLVGRVGGQISKLVAENRFLPTDLFAIARHDSQTFSHVTNVAAYAAMLAEQLGISDRQQLDEIAVGAMLHDLGKRSIPAAILSKQGRLNPDERAIMKTHPLRGYEELRHRKDVTFEQLMMVYQHHEHIDGSGYPVQIRGDEIHPWAKLLAVVDVFDALTGSRPYRRPMPRKDAAEFIRDRSGTHFDKDMAECWTNAIKNS